MKKIIVIVLILAVITGGVLYFIWDSNSYVAKVGGKKITNDEYIYLLRTQKMVTESEAGVTSEDEIRKLWETPVDGEDPVVIVMNQALENAKEFKVQLIKAEQAKYKLSDSEKKEINQYLNEWLQNEENKNYVTKEIGLSLSQFRDMMMKSQLVKGFAYDFMQKNSDAVSVSDEEAEQYYYENRINFDDVAVSHIFISVDDNMDDEQKSEKRKLAEGLLERLRQGENMSQMVKDYSEDPDAKDKDGMLTFKYSDSYDQELKDWAFGAKVGDTDIIETSSGYQVVRLESRSSFEDKKELARSELKSYKLSEYYQEQVKEWVNDPNFNLVKNEKVLNRIIKETFEK